MNRQQERIEDRLDHLRYSGASHINDVDLVHQTALAAEGFDLRRLTKSLNQ